MSAGHPRIVDPDLASFRSTLFVLLLELYHRLLLQLVGALAAHLTNHIRQ